MKLFVNLLGGRVDGIGFDDGVDLKRFWSEFVYVIQFLAAWHNKSPLTRDDYILTSFGAAYISRLQR